MSVFSKLFGCTSGFAAFFLGALLVCSVRDATSESLVSRYAKLKSDYQALYLNGDPYREPRILAALRFFSPTLWERYRERELFGEYRYEPEALSKFLSTGRNNGLCHFEKMDGTTSSAWKASMEATAFARALFYSPGQIGGVTAFSKEDFLKLHLLLMDGARPFTKSRCGVPGEIRRCDESPFSVFFQSSRTRRICSRLRTVAKQSSVLRSLFSGLPTVSRFSALQWEDFSSVKEVCDSTGILSASQLVKVLRSPQLVSEEISFNYFGASVEQIHDRLFGEGLAKDSLDSDSLCQSCRQASWAIKNKNWRLRAFAQSENRVTACPSSCLAVANPSFVKVQERSLISEIRDLVTSRASDQRSLTEAARLAFEVNAIHPFVDGNGRFSRLLFAFILESQGLPFAIYESRELDALAGEDGLSQVSLRGVKLNEAILGGCVASKRCLDAKGTDCGLSREIPGLDWKISREECEPISLKPLISQDKC